MNDEAARQGRSDKTTFTDPQRTSAVGVNSRDLRACVAAAFDARRTAEFPFAVLRIVSAHELAPLIQLDRDLRAARRALLLADAADAAQVWETQSDEAARLWGDAA